MFGFFIAGELFNDAVPAAVIKKRRMKVEDDNVLKYKVGERVAALTYLKSLSRISLGISGDIHRNPINIRVSVFRPWFKSDCLLNTNRGLPLRYCVRFTPVHTACGVYNIEQ